MTTNVSYTIPKNAEGHSMFASTFESNSNEFGWQVVDEASTLIHTGESFHAAMDAALNEAQSWINEHTVSEWMFGIYTADGTMLADNMTANVAWRTVYEQKASDAAANSFPLRLFRQHSTTKAIEVLSEIQR